MTAAHSNRRPILIALFLSGLAALVHEVAWARLLSNLIGSTAVAQAVVLSVFMGGLAIGALVFGKRSDARREPLALYIRLEIAIAIYCVLLPWITRGAGAIYDSSVASNFESGATRFALRVLLATGVVFLPAFLMGGTLPVLARALIDEVGETKRQVASLYGLNNLGAVLGAALGGFLLLPTLGIQLSLVVASSFNLVAAGLASLAKRTRATPERAPETELPPPIYSAAAFRVTLAALFLSGFAAMGYEVVFVRVIALGLGSSTYSFTLMLIGFITGIGIGSLLVAQREVARPLWWLAISQLSAVAALIAVTPFVERLSYYSGSLRVATHDSSFGFETYLVGQGAIVLAILLVPTACIGIGFPLVAHVQARSANSIGGTVGSTYAWNTIGNVLGTVLTSLVILPNLGIENSLHVHLALNLVAGVMLLAVASEAKVGERGMALGACVAVLLVYSAIGRGWSHTLNFAIQHLRMREGPPADATPLQLALDPSASFGNWKQKYLLDAAKFDEVFLTEDADATVLASRINTNVALFINGKGDASTGPFDMITFVLTANLPMFLNPKAKDVLVIGHGSGATAGAALMHPIEHLDEVEISEGVLAADRMFAKFNHGVLTDKKVTIHREDARTFVRTVPRKYDVIMSQPSNPWIAGIGSLFTVEFFRDIERHLNPGGAMLLWFHQYEQSDRSVELVLRTVRQVFPHIEIFFSYADEVIAVASDDELKPDFAAIEARFETPGIRQDLASVSIFNVANLLAYHAVSSSRVDAAFGDGPLNTDDHQRLEYWGAENVYRGTNSRKLTDFDGYGTGKDGASDSLLERYAKWRVEQGDPLSKSELATAVNALAVNLGADDKLTLALKKKLDACTADGAPKSIARGLIPRFEDLSFAEACQRAQNCKSLGAIEVAEALYRRALELEPGDYVPTSGLASMLVEAQRVPDALAVFEASIAKRPDDLHLLLEGAQLCERFEKHDRARDFAQRALAKGENADALVVLGAVAFSAGDGQSAAQFFERALAKDANSWQASWGLVSIYAGSQQSLARAGTILSDALQRDPRNPQLLELQKQLTGR